MPPVGGMVGTEVGISAEVGVNCPESVEIGVGVAESDAPETVKV